MALKHQLHMCIQSRNAIANKTWNTSGQDTPKLRGRKKKKTLRQRSACVFFLTRDPLCTVLLKQPFIRIASIDASAVLYHCSAFIKLLKIWPSTNHRQSTTCGRVCTHRLLEMWWKCWKATKEGYQGAIWLSVRSYRSTQPQSALDKNVHRH